MSKALRRVTLGFCAIASLSATAMLEAAELAAPKAKHILLCVWDGMRPDFITPVLTPNLHALAQRGTFFANHHSSYPTTTEVNGVVLATGMFPSHSGITANREYRPAVDLTKPVATEAAHTMRVLDALTDGHYLGAPTLVERAQRAGLRTIVAGTKPVALLLDRQPEGDRRNGSITLFAGKAKPANVLPPITKAIGPFPLYPDTTTLAEAVTAKPNNVWTRRALTEVLWKRSIPPLTVLWLSDPDYSQHFTVPGSRIAKTSIFETDANLGSAIAILEKRGLLDSTDIFVVSDHGFSTVNRVVDLVSYFRQGGVQVTGEFKLTPQTGDVLINNLAGTTGLHVIGHDPQIVQRLVDLLHASDFAGPVFTASGLAGTFKLSDVNLDSRDAPDIVFSFRWSDGPNENGTSGLIVGEGKWPNFGTHGTLSKYDVRNSLVTAGPDIRSGHRSELPSGNIDLAPTILHLLKLTPGPGEFPCDGRILTEALAGAEHSGEKPVTRRLRAQREVGAGQ